MDLLPTITNLIVYFLIALILVLLITFAFSKSRQSSDDAKNEALEKERERVRVYLRNHPYYTGMPRRVNQKYARVHVYSIPTYSDRSVRKSPASGQIEERKSINRKTRTSGDSFNQRYFVLNSTANFNEGRLGSAETLHAFSSLKSGHHYKY